MKRVHFVVVVRELSSKEIFFDTEIVEAETISEAKKYLEESYRTLAGYELITYKIGRLITFNAIETIK